jgi:hypothetical protein
MAKNRNNRRNRRKTGLQQNQAAMPVTILTPSQEFERELGVASDACVVRAKFYGTYVVNSTAVTKVINFNPNQLGPRIVNFSNVFSRYRVKACMMKIFAPTSVNVTSSTNYSVGVIDDSDSVSGVAPTTFTDVLDSRTSVLIAQSQTQPEFLVWRPQNKSYWYYSAASSDSRESNAFAVYASSSNSTNSTLIIEFEFCIVFAGAIH